MSAAECVPADVDQAIAALRLASRLEGDREVVHSLKVFATGLVGTDEDLTTVIDHIRNAPYVFWVGDALAGHHLCAAHDPDTIVQYEVPLPDDVEFPPSAHPASCDFPVNTRESCGKCRTGEHASPHEHFIEEIVKPKIAECGWYAQGVFQTDADTGIPAFMYTVGMTPAGLPELLIVGLPPQLAHGIITNAVKRHTDTDTEIRAGDEFDLEFTVPFRAVAVAADSTARLLTIAGRVFPDQPIRAIQLMFPDRNGLFPGEPGSQYNDAIITADELAAATGKLGGR